MPFCNNCGAQLTEGGRFCEECGSTQAAAPVQTAPQMTPAQAPTAYPSTAYPPAAVPVHPPGAYGRKDGVVAAILSFIIPGVGQMYCGRVGRGIAIFFGVICGFIFIIPGIIVWIWGIFDANDSVKKYNAYLEAYGQPPAW